VNRDDVLRMAREARDSAPLLTGNTREGDTAWVMNDTHMARFAALVAAHERELCAKVCEGERHIEGQFVANEFAAAIRARAGGA
jgi:hypothetical protein